jgi:hypothetical protein
MACGGSEEMLLAVATWFDNELITSQQSEAGWELASC